VPVVVFNAVNCANVGMVQKGSGSGLAFEALEGFGIAGQIFGDEFEGDMPPQLKIFGLIHYTHATTTELPNDAVVGYSLADHEKTKPPTAVMLGPRATAVNRGQRSKARPEFFIDIGGLFDLPKLT
jgi:hypothetical protein